MMELKKRWRRVSKVDLAWLHFKLALGLMLWSPMWNNPTMQRELTGQILTVWVIVTFIGFLISAVGLVMGSQDETTRHKGFKIELVGLWLLMAGPLVFLAVQAGVWITSGQSRALAVMFPYVVAAAIGARMAMVRAAMRTVLFRFSSEEQEEPNVSHGRHVAE